MRVRIASCFVLALSMLASTAAQAQSWPSRPVTVVVPFAAGVTGDIMPRSLVEHLSGELLQQRTGISFAQTQYRGSPAIISDILGEHIDIGMDSIAPYVALIKENKLRGLAIAAATRWPQLPDVPTVAESGFPGFEAAVWYALLAPAGTPPEIIAKLNEAGNAYLKTKAAAELFE